MSTRATTASRPGTDTSARPTRVRVSPLDCASKAPAAASRLMLSKSLWVIRMIGFLKTLWGLWMLSAFAAAAIQTSPAARDNAG